MTLITTPTKENNMTDQANLLIKVSNLITAIEVLDEDSRDGTRVNLRLAHLD